MIPDGGKYVLSLRLSANEANVRNIYSTYVLVWEAVPHDVVKASAGGIRL